MYSTLIQIIFKSIFQVLTKMFLRILHDYLKIFFNLIKRWAKWGHFKSNSTKWSFEYLWNKKASQSDLDEGFSQQYNSINSVPVTISIGNSRDSSNLENDLFNED